jgi:nucleotide-binding universal stress UspA family protein
MIGQSSSLGVKVHVTERFEPSTFPAELSQDKRVIVVAFDESAESQHSLDWALTNVVNPESDLLIILSVAVFQEPLSFAAMTESKEARSQHKTTFAEGYSSKLSTVASSILEEHKFEPPVRVIFNFSHQAHHEIFVLDSGDARLAIVEFCSLSKADLLVMGNRGLGMVKK